MWVYVQNLFKQEEKKTKSIEEICKEFTGLECNFIIFLIVRVILVLSLAIASFILLLKAKSLTATFRNLSDQRCSDDFTNNFFIELDKKLLVHVVGFHLASLILNLWSLLFQVIFWFLWQKKVLNKIKELHEKDGRPSGEDLQTENKPAGDQNEDREKLK